MQIGRGCRKMEMDVDQRERNREVSTVKNERVKAAKQEKQQVSLERKPSPLMSSSHTTPPIASAVII